MDDGEPVIQVVKLLLSDAKDTRAIPVQAAIEPFGNSAYYTERETSRTSLNYKRFQIHGFVCFIA